MIDVAFEVISKEEHHEKIPVAHILAALLKRVAELHYQELIKPGSTVECFGFCDCYETDQIDTDKRQSLFAY